MPFQKGNTEYKKERKAWGDIKQDYVKGVGKYKTKETPQTALLKLRTQRRRKRAKAYVKKAHADTKIKSNLGKLLILTKDERMQQQNKMFEEFWKTHPHECFECGGPLNKHNQLRRKYFFQLVKNKRFFDPLATDPYNFLLLCDKCRQSYQEHDYRDLPQTFYMIVNKMKLFKERHPSINTRKYKGLAPVENFVNNPVENSL